MDRKIKRRTKSPDVKSSQRSPSDSKSTIKEALPYVTLRTLNCIARNDCKRDRSLCQLFILCFYSVRKRVNQLPLSYARIRVNVRAWETQGPWDLWTVIGGDVEKRLVLFGENDRRTRIDFTHQIFT